MLVDNVKPASYFWFKKIIYFLLLWKIIFLSLYYKGIIKW